MNTSFLEVLQRAALRRSPIARTVQRRLCYFDALLCHTACILVFTDIII
ncbi:MAG: hypothetical protein RSF90_03340 [Pygmaiobacter sp.]